MSQENEPLISVAAAARAEGVARQVLHRQMKQGVFPNYDGRVRLSEVRAGRRDNLDPTHRLIHAERKRNATSAAEPLVRLSEVTEDFARLTEEALDETETDVIDLPHLDIDVSRADAEVLLAAYRGGTANLAAIRALHRRVGVRASG